MVSSNHFVCEDLVNIIQLKSNHFRCLRFIKIQANGGHDDLHDDFTVESSRVHGYLAEKVASDPLSHEKILLQGSLVRGSPTRWGEIRVKELHLEQKGHRLFWVYRGVDYTTQLCED